MPLRTTPVVRIYYRLTDQPSPYSHTGLRANKIETLAGATVPATGPGPYYLVNTLGHQPQILRANIISTSRLVITSGMRVQTTPLSERERLLPSVGGTQTTSQASASILDNASTPVSGVLSLLQ